LKARLVGEITLLSYLTVPEGYSREKWEHLSWEKRVAVFESPSCKVRSVELNRDDKQELKALVGATEAHTLSCEFIESLDNGLPVRIVFTDGEVPSQQFGGLNLNGQPQRSLVVVNLASKGEPSRIVRAGEKLKIENAYENSLAKNIAILHELVHAYRHLNGIARLPNMCQAFQPVDGYGLITVELTEELETVGIVPDTRARFNENLFRIERNAPIALSYTPCHASHYLKNIIGLSNVTPFTTLDTELAQRILSASPSINEVSRSDVLAKEDLERFCNVVNG